MLVDFDNCTRSQKQYGAYKLVYHTAEYLVGHCDTSLPHAFHFRFYGGWYEHRRPTKRAQDFLLELAQSRLTSLVIPRPNGDSFKPVLKLELAYSLGASPNKHLFATFRRRAGIGQLRCRSPKTNGCTSHDCPLDVVCQVLASGKCTNSACSKVSATLISRDEQKLVDTMLVSDLIFYSCIRKVPTCIISADDDMWPGIIAATSLGGYIHHIKPKATGDSHRFYTPIHSQNYRQFSLPT